MTPRALESLTAPQGLMVMGHLTEQGTTIVLLGADASFWNVLTAAPEYLDQLPDPVDRWSQRIVTELARQTNSTARFPFGGPPFQPFIRWAIASGRAWQSPTGMLVHDTAGLMISYRGALMFDCDLGWPSLTTPNLDNPCLTCADQPCAAACPVGALSATTAYDVPRCHDHLATKSGAPCLGQGCAVRRACPVSRAFGRPEAQSAHHMASFHR
jgi:hypothetical protein